MIVHAVLLHAVLALLPATIAGKSFTLPVPDGYGDVTVQLKKMRPDVKDVVAIASHTTHGGARANIVIVPTNNNDDLDLADPKQCALGAQDMLQQHKGGKSKSSAIVDGPTGKTCQISILADSGIVTVFTVLRGPKDSWMMTCTFGEGDADAWKVCQATVTQVKFN